MDVFHTFQTAHKNLSAALLKFSFLHNAPTRNQTIPTVYGLWGQHTHSNISDHMHRVHLHTKHEPDQRSPALQGAQFRGISHLSYGNHASI